MEREAIHKLLRPVARRIVQSAQYRTLLLAWMLLAVLAGLGLLLPLQYGAWLAGVVLVAAIGLIGISLWLTGRPPSETAVARLIEAAHPELDSRLLTALSQDRHDPTQPPSVLQQQLFREVLEHGRRHPWNDVIPQRRLGWLFAGQSVALAIFLVLLATLSFRTSSTVVAQAIPPLIPSLSGFLEIEVEPGSLEVERGQPLLITARFPAMPSSLVELGIRSSEEPSLLRATPNLSMEQSLEDPLFAARFPSVEQDFSYWISAEGRRTSDYQIRVYDLPAVQAWTVTTTPPEYTHESPKTEADVWDLSVVEGTWIELDCRVNKRLSTVELRPASGESLLLQVDPQLETRWTMRFQPAATARYRLSLVDAENRRNREEQIFQVTVVPNRRPDIRIAFPAQDSRVSRLEEIELEAQVSDDFEILEYGVQISIPGREDILRKLDLTEERTRTKMLQHLEQLEGLNVAVDDLISYVVYADDIGPDGQVRRTTSDLFFAEVRPFEEIFRQDRSSAGASGQSGAAGGSQSAGNQLEDLVKQQKQVVTATWNLQKNRSRWDEGANEAIQTIVAAQDEIRQKFSSVGADLPGTKAQLIVAETLNQMVQVRSDLQTAAKDQKLDLLPKALKAEQTAYQGLLRLRAKDHRLQQGQQSGAGAGGGASPSQQQLEQLELTNQPNRYESQRTAQADSPASQRSEDLAIFDRLKELAQRQQALTDRLKELEAQLRTAKTPQEKQDLEAELKRLRDEQQRLLQDADSVRNRLNEAKPSEETTQARDQLEQTRRQMVDSTEALREGRLSQAINSGTRAAEELDTLQNEFRQRSAARFSEDMRNLKQQAAELAQREAELTEALEKLGQENRQTLRESNERRRLGAEFEQQRSQLSQVTERAKQIVEEAETAEPLLSRQLYETLRNARDDRTDEALQAAGQMLQAGVLQQAKQAAEQAGKGIDRLQEGINRAAEAVLGDEVESLKRARQELAELSQELQQELAEQQERASKQSATKVGGAEVEPGATPNGELANGETPGEKGGSSSPKQDGMQSASGSQSGSGQQKGGQGEEGDNSSENALPSQGQLGQGQAGQGQGSGSPGGGDTPSGEQPSENRQGQQRQQGLRSPSRPSGSQQGSPNGGQQSQQAGGDSNSQSGGSQAGGPGGQGGPMSGGQFAEWSDRLRDVESAVSDPEIQAEVARIREQARSIRAESQRHAETPNWELVKSRVQAPLIQLQQRLAEEIARRSDPESLVPVDRDPVPSRYRELVDSYYQRLGSGEVAPRRPESVPQPATAP